MGELEELAQGLEKVMGEVSQAGDCSDALAMPSDTSSALSTKPDIVNNRRSRALGNLRVLPDEIIDMIVSNLSMRDVMAMACVSSVLNVFCTEDPLWMKLCLESLDEEDLVYEGSWRQTGFCRLAREKKISEMPKCLTRRNFPGFDSWFLYNRWYRCHVKLKHFDLGQGVVERRGRMTPEEFREDFDGQKPVLLTDAMESWSAKSSWTVDQLAKMYPNTRFRISQPYGSKLRMRFEDYKNYMAQQNDEDPLYIFDPKFGEKEPNLLKDYDVPSVFDEDFLSVLGPENRPPYRWLVLGPQRSGATWHVDPGMTSAWNALLVGRKRWSFYPPGWVPPGFLVHVDEETGEVDFLGEHSLKWWMETFPYLAPQDRPMECTQLPGEIIFVPSGWWHCVLNLEDTVAVTQNFVNTVNLEKFCIDLAPGYKHRGIARAGRIAEEWQERNRRKQATNEEKDDKSIHQNQNGTEGKKEKSEQVEEKGGGEVNNGVCDGGKQDHDRLSKGVLEEEGSLVAASASLLERLDEWESQTTMPIGLDGEHYSYAKFTGRYLDRRDVRGLLRKLWVLRPDLHENLWKGACVVSDAGRWLRKVKSICLAHCLPYPVGEEVLPVGSGSNPVYLVGNHVVKIFVDTDDDATTPRESFSRECYVYEAISKSMSPLTIAIPAIAASGILYEYHDKHYALSWNGKGNPPEKADMNGGEKQGLENPQKKQDAHAETGFPYLITVRLRGEELCAVRKTMSKEDLIGVATDLGKNVTHLHSLPVLLLANGGVNGNGTEDVDIDGGDVNRCCSSSHIDLPCTAAQGLQQMKVPRQWEEFVSRLRKQRTKIVDQLNSWESLPQILRAQVLDYIPQDPAVLCGLQVAENSAVCGPSPVWLHTDITDDNIIIGLEAEELGRVEAPINCRGEAEEKNDGDNINGGPTSSNSWRMKCLVDFGDAVMGDPLYEMVAVYLSALDAKADLFSEFLKHYTLPLSVSARRQRYGCPELACTAGNLQRSSYRTMCFCLLHDQDVMKTLFRIRKDLRKAKSLEEVELAFWGMLNHHE